MNSSDRKLVHEIAESLSLGHESIGEGKERFIRVTTTATVSTKNAKTETPKPVQQTEEVKESVNSVSVVTCNSCKKSVPRTNIELHKVRCVAPAPASEVRKEAPKLPKKKSSKKKQTESTEEEDFDSLCAQFQKLDTICNFPKCKTLVATLGVNCKFCLVRFCLTHSMAEVHGCGEEARKTARQQMLREGRITPGSGTVSHKLDRDKRAQLNKKLDKKLAEKSDQRQRKKKE